jgi:RNA polymerase sigma factor (sigma-70 family)
MRLASDARLVALIREGRRLAFEVAYDRHQRSILSFCRHVLGDPQEAEDAVQHTFLAAYNDLISSDKPIQLKAWLFAIARNRCYSVLRARREHPAADLSEETATEGLATQVQRRQDLRDLVLDMRRLPGEQRAALVLAELDALSHEQIGVALGVPREKVKALVFQARESLVASRVARETDCAVIRAQLANLRGGALRRANLRRHLRECPGCRDFRHQVERQRRQLAVLLPVVPALALKESVLTPAIAGGASAGARLAGGAGVLAGTAVKSGLMKGAIGVVVAAVGAGTIAAAGDLDLSWSSSGLPLKHRLPAANVGSAGTSTPVPVGQHAILMVSHPLATRSARTSGGSRLTVRSTIPLPGIGAKIPTDQEMHAATPFVGSAGQLAPRIIQLRPEPSRTAGEQGGGTLAPVQQAPTLTPIGGAQPAALAPAAAAPAAGSQGVAGPADPGSHGGTVRVGHDGGNGPVTGTATVTTGKGSSGPAGGSRGQTGSGAIAGADGSTPSESAPPSSAPAGAPSGSGAAPATGSAGTSGVGKGLSSVAPVAPSGASRS